MKFIIILIIFIAIVAVFLLIDNKDKRRALSFAGKLDDDEGFDTFVKYYLKQDGYRELECDGEGFLLYEKGDKRYAVRYILDCNFAGAEELEKTAEIVRKSADAGIAVSRRYFTEGAYRDAAAMNIELISRRDLIHIAKRI